MTRKIKRNPSPEEIKNPSRTGGSGRGSLMIFSLSKRKRGKKQVLASKKRTSFCILLYTRKPAIVKLFCYCPCVCVCVFFRRVTFSFFTGHKRVVCRAGVLFFDFVTPLRISFFTLYILLGKKWIKGI